MIIVKLGAIIFKGRSRHLAQLALLVAISSSLQLVWAEDDDPGAGKFSPEAAATFSRRCTACHTYGKGIKVGPDLKGVTERRKRDWLLKFIHESSRVIKSGDATAVSLFAEFKQQRMPDWTDLSETQIADILDYISIGGPDIKPADERNAELALPAEIEIGRQLFSGERPSKYGAQACRSCHAVRGTGWGGSLGPDLTRTYLKFQDRALTEFLRHPCFQWQGAGAGAHYLTAKESFALKAFLRQAAVRQAAQSNAPPQLSHPTRAEKLPSTTNPAAMARQSSTGKRSAP